MASHSFKLMGLAFRALPEGEKLGVWFLFVCHALE